MPNNIFRVFGKLIKMIEGALIRVLVIGLVLLITIQIILANPNLERSLISKVPIIDKLLRLGRNNEFVIPARTVFSIEEEYIVISLQNDLRLPQVELWVNDNLVGDFSHGFVRAKVKKGDQILVDARGIKQGLWFKVTGLSTVLPPFKVGQQFWVKNEAKVLGIITATNKF